MNGRALGPEGTAAIIIQTVAEGPEAQQAQQFTC